MLELYVVWLNSWSLILTVTLLFTEVILIKSFHKGRIGVKIPENKSTWFMDGPLGQIDWLVHGLYPTWPFPKDNLPRDNEGWIPDLRQPLSQRENPVLLELRRYLIDQSVS